MVTNNIIKGISNTKGSEAVTKKSNAKAESHAQTNTTNNTMLQGRPTEAQVAAQENLNRWRSLWFTEANAG